jgi:hypothetical protein
VAFHVRALSRWKRAFDSKFGTALKILFINNNYQCILQVFWWRSEKWPSLRKVTFNITLDKNSFTSARGHCESAKRLHPFPLSSLEFFYQCIKTIRVLKMTGWVGIPIVVTRSRRYWLVHIRAAPGPAPHSREFNERTERGRQHWTELQFMLLTDEQRFGKIVRSEAPLQRKNRKRSSARAIKYYKIYGIVSHKF